MIRITIAGTVLAAALVGGLATGYTAELPSEEPDGVASGVETNPETTGETTEATRSTEATTPQEEILAVQPPSVEPSPAAPPATGLTAEQQENRRILAEREAAYDGTGPSPWVQGQMDHAGIASTNPPRLTPEKDAQVREQAKANGCYPSCQGAAIQRGEVVP